MAAAPQPDLLTLEEYLHTTYRPDCDFVDGYLEERNVGSIPHSLLLAELIIWFGAYRTEWNIRVLGDIRTRVSPSRIRLPDVAIVSRDTPFSGNIWQSPPLIAIEILSPEDRIPRVVKRLDDFLKMGVQNIWLIDPEERAAFTYTAEGLRLVDSLQITLPNSPIHLDLPAIFAALD